MKKVQTIKFEDFMSGKWKEEPKRKPIQVNGIIPMPTFSGMFFNEPCIVIGSIGLVLIGLTVYEKYLIAQGKDVEAERVATYTTLALGTGVLGASVVLITKVGGAFL